MGTDRSRRPHLGPRIISQLGKLADAAIARDGEVVIKAELREVAEGLNYIKALVAWDWERQRQFEAAADLGAELRQQVIADCLQRGEITIKTLNTRSET